MFDITARVRAKNVDGHRTFHDNVGEIDACIASSVVNKFGTHETHVLRYISTGAFLNELQLCEIGWGNGLCQYCKAKVHDSAHILWNCPVINGMRKFNELSALRSCVCQNAYNIAYQQP